ncbi:tetratricopeptide repeat protein [Neobacillus niacini]|uniref:tetratricopeptide repeat protein n=1 Tax=Neobacillus niacini TaxID=86668 RepID=UPI00203C8B74|nr:tetratricopeptide repeat protein [Neobacillus niacini]MCM3689686.1 sel1 repeat family protein [Neobacillus niacini]
MKVAESEFDANRMPDSNSCPVDQENGLKDSPQFLFNEYKKFYEAERFSEALEFFTLSLKTGFPCAEFEMGQHCYYGSEQLGISKDYMKAFNYFSTAATQGHADALYYQGLMYLKGIGVALDMNQALLTLNNAANQNANKALDTLGKIYHFGYCKISQDPKKAERYYRIAVNQGYPPSMFHLALLLENQSRFEEASELMIQSANMQYIKAINYYMSTYK